MNMDFSYDEDLAENPFFVELRQEHETLLEEAIAGQWIICVPRGASLGTRTLFTEPELLSHILVPEPELPATRFISLAGDSVTVSGGVLTMEVTLRRVRLLFKETFYTKRGRHVVWCIESPLSFTPNTDETLLRSLNGAGDCIRFLWTETGSGRLIEDIYRCIEKNRPSRRIEKCESLREVREAAEKAYSKCLADVLADARLRAKCERSRSFRSNVRLAVETLFLRSSYGDLSEKIGALSAGDDARFNKILRNLSRLQLKDFDVDAKYAKNVPEAKKILSGIADRRSALEKIGSLKRALASIANSTDERFDDSRGLTADELLPIVIFLIVKSGLPNWICQLNFLKYLRFGGDEDDRANEFGYCIATIEAAIEFAFRGGLSNFPFRTSESTFAGEPDALTHLFSRIESSDFDEVRRILGRNVAVRAPKPPEELEDSDSVEDVPNGGKFDDRREFCHPLCDCVDCRRSLEARRPPTVFSRDARGYTALHVACVAGEPRIVDFLIEIGSEIDAIDRDGSSPLHCASARGHQNAQLLLLSAGANPNRRDSEMNTALHLASDGGHANCVKALAYFAEHRRIDLEINAKNDFGDTPLHAASKWGFEPIARFLLECGANPLLKNAKGKTPIDVSQSVVMMKLLSANVPNLCDYDNISIDFPLDEEERSSETESRFGDGSDEKMNSLSIDLIKRIERLFCAITYGDIKLACFYLNIDENVTENEKNHLKEATFSKLCHPLCACSECSKLVNNFSPSDSLHLQLSDAQGNTALHVAARHGRLDICKMLLRNGALVNVKNKIGYTPFHLAIKYSKLAIAEIFVENDVNINLRDNLGNTPLHLACENDHVEMVELLLKLKPTLTINVVGKTALEIAQDHMHLTICTLIEEYSQTI